MKFTTLAKQLDMLIHFTVSRHFWAVGTLVLAATGGLARQPQPARADSFQVIHSFNGSDGRVPFASPTLVGSTLYGTTAFGGDNDYGTVYSINPDGSDFQVLHSFRGVLTVSPLRFDGHQSHGGITAAGSTLYGTTWTGGNKSDGTVFSLSLDGTAYKIAHSFDGATDGDYPEAGLTLNGSTLFGTTSNGGANGKGTVFSLNPDGSGYQVVHSFNSTDGDAPTAIVSVVGSRLYGTAAAGGENNRGVIFSLNPDGSDYQVVHSFNGLDGSQPWAGLTLVGATLYGTTVYGGVNDEGALFSMNLDGTGYQVLHSFGSSADGRAPLGELTLVGAKLYGTTYLGGTGDNGTIFSLDLDGSGYQVVHSLTSTDGFQPNAGLTLVGSTLYGTTSIGGAQSHGTIFAITVPEPSTWMLATMGIAGLIAMSHVRRRGRCQGEP